MNYLSKTLITFCLLITILFTNISGSSSSWSGINLTQDEMENSVKFQLSRGGNCKGECEKLIPTLDRFIKNTYSAESLVHILGEPNSKTENRLSTNYIYNLAASNTTTLLTLIIKGDKLESYTLTGN
jgi:hypothetical protein